VDRRTDRGLSLRPRACGNLDEVDRVAVRWATLVTPGGRGVVIRSDDLPRDHERKVAIGRFRDALADMPSVLLGLARDHELAVRALLPVASFRYARSTPTARSPSARRWKAVSCARRAPGSSVASRISTVAHTRAQSWATSAHRRSSSPW
jgi:hypothetical protein